MIYYIIIGTIIFGGYLLGVKKEWHVNFYIAILFFFTAFRNPYIMGTDNRSYFLFFENAVPLLKDFGDYSHTYEIGYALINSLAKTIYNDFLFFQVLYTLFSIILLYLIIKNLKLSNSEKCLFLFVYFSYRYFQNSMEFLRQNIATLFVWLTLLQLQDQAKPKYVKNIAMTIIGWLFHRSAMFSIVIFLIVDKFKNINTRLLFRVTIISSILLYSIPLGFIDYIINIAIIIGGDRYSSYLIEESTTLISINIVNYFLRLIFYAFYIWRIDKIDYEKKGVIAVISSIAIIFGSINVGIFTRMLEYAMIGIYVNITISLRSFTKDSKKIMALGLYIIFMIILLRNLYSVSGGTYMNYQLFFFE